MKKVFLSFCTTIIMLCSCTSDYGLDVLGLEDFSMSPEKSIASFLSDSNEILTKSGLTLVKNTELSTSQKIDIETFFNSDFNCYPVYSRDLKFMKLENLDFIKSDTSTIHFKYEYLRSYVDSLLDNRKNLVIRELTWNYRGETIKTIGLFNRFSGEMEYDNVLFNLISQKYNFVRNSTNLTRSESNSLASNRESVYVTVGGNTYYYDVCWSIYGNYHTYEGEDSDGNTTSIRVFEIEDVGVVEYEPDLPSSLNLVYRNNIYAFHNEHLKVCCAVSIGMGDSSLQLPTIPLRYDEYNTSCYDGVGYAYKTIVEK